MYTRFARRPISSIILRLCAALVVMPALTLLDPCASHANVKILPVDPLPSQVDLTRWLPPVGDQGRTGSTVGWATGYYCYTAVFAKQRNLTPVQIALPQNQFSPAFLWHPFNNGEADHGMMISQAFDLLNTQGCATLAEMPWSADEVASQPSADAKASAAAFKALKTVNLMVQGQPVDSKTLKTWLAVHQVPLVIGIRISQNFTSIPHDPSYVYPAPAADDPNNPVLGGHAVCIVGYDDSKHAFRIVNSWGKDWGNQGFLWLSEDDVTKNTLEAWGVLAPPAP